MGRMRRFGSGLGGGAGSRLGDEQGRVAAADCFPECANSYILRCRRDG